MSVGLIALLDDVVAIAKAAAASLDDVIAQSARAGAKSAGVVIDDAAVTPRYVVGLDPSRELPIVWRIAIGSLRNKLLILLPLALLLSAFAPWLVTPLLMLGGAYLCYEGAEKVVERFLPHDGHGDTDEVGVTDAVALETSKVQGAIRTDFILSAEIMAIALAAIPSPDLGTRAAVLAIVGVGITALVYGGVAMIVKADDAGLALAARPGGGALGALGRGLGRALVRGMPGFLAGLSLVGTAAMIWVGGGIVVHGLEGFGLSEPAHVIHDLAAAAGSASPVAPAAVAWLIGAVGAGLCGFVLGFVIVVAVHGVVLPLAARMRA